MPVTEDRVKNIEDDVEGHSKTLYGKEGRGGLVIDVQKNTSFRQEAKWFIRIVTVAIVSSLVAGVVYAVKLMSTMQQMVTAVGGG